MNTTFNDINKVSTGFTVSDLWESRLISPDVPFARYTKEPAIRKFHLVAQPIDHNILSNITIKAMGYNGSTPGPVIVVKQDEYVSITVENRLDEDTSLHVHGLAKPNSQDGTPDIEPNNPPIRPGESLTYTFLCWQSGTFFYHSTTAFQVSRGLMGAFIVIPRDEKISELILPHHDFVLLLQQWEIPQPQLGEIFPGTYTPNKFDRNPNFFTINGKSFPDTSSMFVKKGEHIKMRFINKSSSSHSMHLHGHDFYVTVVDGFPRDNHMDDTISVASGKRIEVDFLALNPGVWPLNGTKTFHQSNNGETPGGMTSRFVYLTQ